MRKLLIIAGVAALAMFVVAPVAQAAPKHHLVSGSGIWRGGALGTRPRRRCIRRRGRMGSRSLTKGRGPSSVMEARER